MTYTRQRSLFALLNRMNDEFFGDIYLASDKAVICARLRNVSG